MTYQYLISYIDSFPGGFANANTVLSRPVPIQDLNDVRDIEAALREQLNLNRVVLMGFSRFEETQ